MRGRPRDGSYVISQPPLGAGCWSSLSDVSQRGNRTIGEYLRDLCELVAGGNVRGRQDDRIATNALDISRHRVTQQTSGYRMLVDPCADFDAFVKGRFVASVRNEFHSDKQSPPPNVAHRLQVAERVAKQRSKYFPFGLDTFNETISLDDSLNRRASGARSRMSSKGVPRQGTAIAFHEDVHDRAMIDSCAERQVASA